MTLSKNKIKLLNSLKHKKFRQKYNIFIVEGDKVAKELLFSNYPIHTLYGTGSWINQNRKLIDSAQFPVVQISESELSRISFLKTPNSVLLVVNIIEERVNEKLFQKGFHLYLDGIRDPGNLGTIIRTADWFGIRSVVKSPDSVDFYNPKVIQATMGSLFRIPHFTMNLDVLVKRVNYRGPVIAAKLTGINVSEYTFSEPSILIVGNESLGIRSEILGLCNESISIPKSGTSHADSLNAAIAVAIISSRMMSQSEH